MRYELTIQNDWFEDKQEFETALKLTNAIRNITNRFDKYVYAYDKKRKDCLYRSLPGRVEPSIDLINIPTRDLRTSTRKIKGLEV